MRGLNNKGSHPEILSCFSVCMAIPSTKQLSSNLVLIYLYKFWQAELNTHCGVKHKCEIDQLDTQDPPQLRCVELLPPGTNGPRPWTSWETLGFPVDMQWQNHALRKFPNEHLLGWNQAFMNLQVLQSYWFYSHFVNINALPCFRTLCRVMKYEH